MNKEETNILDNRLGDVKIRFSEKTDRYIAATRRFNETLAAIAAGDEARKRLPAVSAEHSTAVNEFVQELIALEAVETEFARNLISEKKGEKLNAFS